MSPPQHSSFDDSELRAKVDKVMRNTLNTRKRHTMMRMKKYWDFKDRSLIVNGKNISQSGWETYWMSIDSAVQFWE